MRLLRDELMHFARRNGLRRGIEAAAVIRAARELLPTVLPTTVRDDVVIESFHDGVLQLRAPSGSALATVHLYRTELLSALKQKIGRSTVEKVRVLPR